MFNMEVSRSQKKGPIKGIHNISDKETVFGLRTDLIISLFLAIITLACYWQITNHEFINYDDDVYVTENNHVKNGLKLKSVLWAFTAEVAENWHPLTLLSHMLDCQLFELNPGGHHLTSLFFHVINTLLLFAVLKLMTNALWPSAFVAALFALHPMHVESVAWVAERKDVLSTFFFLLSMWAYILYVDSLKTRTYILILLLFALGLMAKPMLVTFPFLLLLIDYWPLNRFRPGKTSGWNLLIEKIPLFVFSALSCIITYFVQQQGGAVASLNAFPLTVRIANALVSYVVYIFKMIWPFHLSVVYPHPQMFPWWQLIGAFALLLTIFLLTFKNAKRYPYLAVGWLWYVGTLVPVIGLVQVGSQAMADRYTYIPFIGLFIMIAWYVDELFGIGRYKKTGLALITAFLITILSIMTLLQLSYWKNTITLFAHALKETENNCVAHFNIGIALAKQNKTDKAIEHYFEALQINPRLHEVHNNLGIALASQDRETEAVTHYSEALRINPSHVKAHNNLGIALTNQGLLAQATKHFREALRIDSENATAHNGMGIALASQGNTQEAISYFTKALRVDPSLGVAHKNLGISLVDQGRIREAGVHFSKALEINPKDAEAHNGLAFSLQNQGDIENAIIHYSKALTINPEYAEAHNGMGVAMAKQGRIPDAIKHFHEALRIDPNHSKAKINLDRAMAHSISKSRSVE